MPIYWIIGYISAFVWIFPAIRQFKSNFFYYFLFIALCDPFGLLNTYFLHIIDPNKVITIVSLLLFYSTQYGEHKTSRRWIFNLLIALIYLCVLLFLKSQNVPIAILRTLVLFKFIQKAVINVYGKGELNFFYLALIFYELSIVFNFLVILGGTEPDIIVFISTLSFQILVALFFIIFREDSPALVFKIKPAK